MLTLAPGRRPGHVGLPQGNHVPAEFTILNFPVPDIEAAVDQLRPVASSSNTTTGSMSVASTGRAGPSSPGSRIRAATFSPCCRTPDLSPQRTSRGRPKRVRTPGVHSGRSMRDWSTSMPHELTRSQLSSTSSAACSGQGACQFGTQMVLPATFVCRPQREVSQVSNRVGLMRPVGRTAMVPRNAGRGRASAAACGSAPPHPGDRPTSRPRCKEVPARCARAAPWPGAAPRAYERRCRGVPGRRPNTTARSSRRTGRGRAPESGQARRRASRTAPTRRRTSARGRSRRRTRPGRRRPGTAGPRLRLEPASAET